MYAVLVLQTERQRGRAYRVRSAAFARPSPSVAKIAQDAAGTAAVRDDPVLIDGPHTVDPHAVHADGGRVEPRGARRQVVHAALGAARDAGRVEQQQVCPRAGHEPPAIRDAVRSGDVARHALHGFWQREVTALAYPVAEQVQPEAR